MKAKKRFGYIMAGPSEFAIHRRGGRIRHVGRGIGFISLPLIDRYYLIPSTAQSVTFAADQITAENQGVEVAGFAIWKVADPQKASASFDFTDGAGALGIIGENLRQVVESAIRHQVANMTIEDVLKKRGSIILQLKNELAYMAEQWGLVIETVEIRTVRVQSAQLFAQMQAGFRDAMRLQSERSALDTEKRLAEHRLEQKEQLALKEREFERGELERDAEAQRARITVETAVQAFKLDHQRQLLAAELRLYEGQAVLEAARKKHEAALAEIADETKRRQIETANTENETLALIRQLPAALGAMNVTELHLGDDVLRSLASSLMASIRKASA